jgi:hypothetical protein
MKQTALTLLSVLALGGTAVAQGPTPDFRIDPVILQPNFALLEFRVQGPPNCPATIFASPDDPLSLVIPRRIRTFARIQLDNDGNGVLSLPLQGQGPIPDVWFTAVLFPPAQPSVRANVVHLAGAFAFALMPTSSCVIDYEKRTMQLDVDAKTTPDTKVSIWEVDCADAPYIGVAFTPPANAAQVHCGNSDASGGFHWSGTRDVTRCIVVAANGVVIGVMRKH